MKHERKARDDARVLSAAKQQRATTPTTIAMTLRVQEGLQWIAVLTVNVATSNALSLHSRNQPSMAIKKSTQSTSLDALKVVGRVYS